MKQQIERLHKCYNQLVPEGAVTFNMSREMTWKDWLMWRRDEPFTETDLNAVIQFRRVQIKAGRHYSSSLRFSYLIGSPDWFEETLAEAVHARRKHKDEMLCSRGPPGNVIPFPQGARPTQPAL